MNNKKLIKIARKLIAGENNIDVSCFYDVDISRIDCEQCFNFWLCSLHGQVIKLIFKTP